MGSHRISRSLAAVLFTLAVAAWASSCTTLDDVTAPSCAFSLSSASASFGTGGGTGNVTVHAASSCSWSVTASDPWVALTGPASGSGDGSIAFAVAANTGAAMRNATLNVSGQAFTVSQSGTTPSCTFAVAPSTASFSEKGGNGTITVTTAGGCAWTATSQVGWITITAGRNWAGNGTVSYRVNENKSKNARTGTVTVGGRTVTISQAGED